MEKNMNMLKLVLASTLLVFSMSAFGSQSLIDSKEKFSEIDNFHEEAKAWAMCSVVYEVASGMMQEKSPAQAELVQLKSDGAKIATGMAFLSGVLDDGEQEMEFGSAWKAAQSMVEKLPALSLVHVKSEAEKLGVNSKSFMKRISDTLSHCMANQSMQQDYLDSWRELQASGKLEFN